MEGGAAIVETEAADLSRNSATRAPLFRL